MSRNAIKTTHVGSLVRPDGLVGAIEHTDHASPDFERTLNQAVEDVVRRQVAIGLDIINDGEYAKFGSWSRYVLDRLAGLVERPAPAGESQGQRSVTGKDMRDFAAFYGEYFQKEGAKPSITGTEWAVTGPVRYRGAAAVAQDIARLKAACASAGYAGEAFITAVSPASVLPTVTQDYYRSEEEYLFALADALREEYRCIVDAGLIVQLDDAYLASTFDVMVPPATLEDYRRWAAIRVDAINHSLRGLPSDRTRYHVCWGSWNGPHSNDVEIKHIVDLILKVETGGYLLEMANPRHEHEWRVWETVKLPEGRKLYPGVVSHATNVVEHPELVAERITRLAKLAGPENVIASTDCGFAQGPTVRRVHASVMWAKLAALVQGAQLASRELGR